MSQLRKRSWAALLLLFFLVPLPCPARPADPPAASDATEDPELWVAPRGVEIVRVVDAGVDEARAALLAVLEEDDLVPDEDGPETGFVTTFAEVVPGRFQGEVARPVPTTSLMRPVLQPRVPRKGNYRLWVRFESLDEGCRVALVAEMYQRLHSLSGWGKVEQTSTGTIERHYLDRLETRLAAPDDSPGLNQD